LRHHRLPSPPLAADYGYRLAVDVSVPCQVEAARGSLTYACRFGDRTLQQKSLSETT